MPGSAGTRRRPGGSCGGRGGRTRPSARRPSFSQGGSAMTADLIPAQTEDAQAFAERMVVAGHAGLAEAVAFARAGRRGMALYVAGQAAVWAGNRAAGPDVPVSADRLDAALAAMIATLTDVRA